MFTQAYPTRVLCGRYGNVVDYFLDNLEDIVAAMKF